ncbi:MAG: hypothetical protein KC478_10670 [Bacteriovoracaceae bacterium]|nr:hypothetical protein [Bacteriovoracaceae bacterium]
MRLKLTFINKSAQKITLGRLLDELQAHQWMLLESRYGEDVIIFEMELFEESAELLYSLIVGVKEVEIEKNDIERRER